MDARGTCDGRHRARKHCPDPECYLLTPPTEPGSEGLLEIVEHQREVAEHDLNTKADQEVQQLVACGLQLDDLEFVTGHPTQGTHLVPFLRHKPSGARLVSFPPTDSGREVDWHNHAIDDALAFAAAGAGNLVTTDLPWRPKNHGGQGQPSVAGFVARAAEPQPGDPEWWVFARDNPGRAKEIVRDHARASVVEMDALNARATMAGLAEHPIEFGPGIFRWACTRDGGYQRTEYAHELPPAPAGWRWSSAQVTAVGGRGKLHVSAAVVDGSEGANAPTGPQSLVLEITGRGGYCTGLDVVLFARPAEVQR